MLFKHSLQGVFWFGYLIHLFFCQFRYLSSDPQRAIMLTETRQCQEFNCFLMLNIAQLKKKNRLLKIIRPHVCLFPLTAALKSHAAKWLSLCHAKLSNDKSCELLYDAFCFFSCVWFHCSTEKKQKKKEWNEGEYFCCCWVHCSFKMNRTWFTGGICTSANWNGYSWLFLHCRSNKLMSFYD